MAVAHLGGKCICCGYDKCVDALEFHHRDPSQKDFAPSAKGHTVSWDRLRAEIAKCDLLCANCHREVHNGIRALPDILPGFNENFVSYKQAGKDTPCKKCGKPKPETQTYCSRSCAASVARKVDWSLIDLASMLKLRTKAAIAEELGISWNAVDKRAKKLGL